jgi:hypothetical protein
MLIYIRGVIKKALRMRGEIDLSRINCQYCQGPLHFHYRLLQEYSCSRCADRCSENCCNKYMALIAVVLVLVAITLAIFLSQVEGMDVDNKWLYMLIGVFVAEAFTLLLAVGYFFHSYMSVKRLVLGRMMEDFDAHSNSADSIISDEWEVVIRH